MRYYFHLLTERERLRDPDGDEFSTLDAAREEATQSARDLIAEHIRSGHAIPLQWCIQIAQQDDTMVDTVRFASLCMGDGGNPSRPRIMQKIDPEFIARAKATFEYARTTNAEIGHHLAELRDNLQTLSRLNRTFTEHLRA